MAKKISRSQRRARSRKVSDSSEQTFLEVKRDRSAQSKTPNLAPELVYSYPLISIRRDLIKSLILFVVFITIVVVLSTTQWF